jgi:hypothetical protein
MPGNKSFASMIPRPEAFSRREAVGAFFFGANNDLRESAASKSGAPISASARRSLLNPRRRCLQRASYGDNQTVLGKYAIHTMQTVLRQIREVSQQIFFAARFSL